MNEEQADRLNQTLADQTRTMRSLEGTIERLLPALLKASAPGAAGNSRATVTQTDRTPMWICVVIVVGLVVAQWNKGDNQREEITRLQAQLNEKQGQLNDVRADVRELRAVDQELRATDNAVRAYINTGILKPKTVGKGN